MGDVSTAFIEEFDSMVKLAYQREGSLLRNTVRQKNNVSATKNYFQKMGKGTATTKGRNGIIPPMNPDHTRVSFTLSDRYAAEYVDDLDDQKINIDEKKALQDTAVYALGRETDQDIIDVLDTTSVYAGTDTDGMTKEKIQEALFKTLLKNDVPDDGRTVCVLGWDQWSELMDIPEFKNADFIGNAALPWVGSHQVKQWLNILWIPHSGLTVSSNVRKCHMYHYSAVGHGSGCDIKTEVAWISEKDSWFVKAKMSMGACVIDTTGIVTLRCLET
jgi:hypothetical protein